MRIALIMENSQASKNALVYETLKKVCDRHGFELDNYGMTAAEDKKLNVRSRRPFGIDFIKFWCG